MPQVKEEEGCRRSTRGRGEDPEPVLALPSRVKGRVALRSDRTAYRRCLRARKEGGKEEDMLELGPTRRSKPGRKRKRAVPSPPDSPSDDRTASSSSSWAFAEARAGKSSNANTPTSRAAASDAGGFRNDVTEEEFHSPGVTWPYLETSGVGGGAAGGGGGGEEGEEELRSSGPPPHPLINKIRMTKQLQSLCAKLFELKDDEANVFESDKGLSAVKSAVVDRIANYHYKSFYAFKSDFEMLMRKHCTSSESREAVKRELADLVGKYKPICEGKDADSQQMTQPYTSLPQLRQKMCDELLATNVSFRRPESDLGSPPPAFTSSVVRMGRGAEEKPKNKEKKHGLGRGKKPVKVGYKADRRVLVSDSEDEDEDSFPSVIEPLVITRQPPPLFIAGMYATKDTHFEVEVRVPDAMRKKMRLESAVPLVVELRYEGGDSVDQQPLQVLEEPLMFPGQDRWVVRAKINATSFKHGKRKFALWLDVSQFEQRSHNLWVQGTLTEGINVVSSMAQPAKKRRRRVEA